MRISAGRVVNGDVGVCGLEVLVEVLVAGMVAWSDINNEQLCFCVRMYLAIIEKGKRTCLLLACLLLGFRWTVSRNQLACSVCYGCVYRLQGFRSTQEREHLLQHVKTFEWS